MIVGKNIKKKYGSLEVLKGVDVTIEAGEVVSIVGSSGAGKTTLLRMITGKEKPDSGNIKIGETVKIAYADQSRTLDPDTARALPDLMRCVSEHHEGTAGVYAAVVTEGTIRAGDTVAYID